jgi:large subunit ribosomal protein L22
MKAIYRRAKISPKKANLVASMIKGMMVKEALTRLRFTPKKGAKIIYDILKSAVANAENNFNQKDNELVITSILVTKGTVQRRFIPISRGRVHPILKKTAHIIVEVNAKPTGGQAKGGDEKKEKIDSNDKKGLAKKKQKAEVLK